MTRRTDGIGLRSVGRAADRLDVDRSLEPTGGGPVVAIRFERIEEMVSTLADDEIAGTRGRRRPPNRRRSLPKL